MVSDDFSFPKMSNPLPLSHFAISPSLWRVSSVVYPDQDDEGLARKGLYQLENQDVNDQEKMDMLWEDFNEELQRVSSSSNNKRPSSSSGREKLQLCRLQDLNMSKLGSIYQPKKQSFLLVVKVLKKIFLLHKSSAHIKKN